jgi:hypothetical protein
MNLASTASAASPVDVRRPSALGVDGGSSGGVQASMDCTPAAVLTALQLVHAPGATALLATGTSTAIDAVRLLSINDPTRALDPALGIYPTEAAHAVTQLGATASVTRSIDTLLDAARNGSPVVASGDGCMLAYLGTSEDAQPYRAHSITLIGPDDATTGQWRISDPAAPAPTSISETVLRGFLTSTPAGFAAPDPGSTTYDALIVSHRA